MAQADTSTADHFTVFIRLPFPRGDFIDPPPVEWTAEKQRRLWDELSQSADIGIDWQGLATDLDVSLPFLEQQAAWTYQRHLSQVRAQMRKVGTAQVTSPSPLPGQVQALKRPDSISRKPGDLTRSFLTKTGSREPSRLSIRQGGSKEGSLPGTPVLPSSFPHRQHHRGSSTASARQISNPAAQQETTESSVTRQPSSRERPYIRSPEPNQSSSSSSSSSSSDSEHEKPNKPTTYKKFARLSTYKAASRANIDEESNDDETAPAFLPYDAEAPDPANTDPSATLRLEREQQQQQQQQQFRHHHHHHHSSSHRPHPLRRQTSERLPPPEISPTSSSNDSSTPHPGHSNPHNTNLPRADHRKPMTGPLSPRRTAELAQRSPRHRAGQTSSTGGNGTKDGSDGSPSITSSYSDLDDASLTESALQEAYLNQRPGMASRMTSTISQALRSRHF